MSVLWMKTANAPVTKLDRNRYLACISFPILLWAGSSDTAQSACTLLAGRILPSCLLALVVSGLRGNLGEASLNVWLTLNSVVPQNESCPPSVWILAGAL